MNTVVIGWETRNAKRSASVALWCKNLGLVAITRTTHVGLLTVRERAELKKKLQGAFTRPTDRFYMLLLCDTCVPLAVLPQVVSKNMQENQTPFEIITVNKNAQ